MGQVHYVIVALRDFESADARTIQSLSLLFIAASYSGIHDISGGGFILVTQTSQHAAQSSRGGTHVYIERHRSSPNIESRLTSANVDARLRTARRYMAPRCRTT